MTDERQSVSLDGVALLRRLVAVDTTSARSNLPLIELLEEELHRIGFVTERQEWTDESSGAAKANLIAQRGSGRPALALVGHTDCVPFDPDWAGALAGESVEGKLYGRGAADTKGFIAAALTASARTHTHRLPLLLVFTADEEVGCLGAKRLVEFFNEPARAGQTPLRAIIGEPTRLIPVIGHKGYCQADIEIQGAEGHSAFPETGASAILAAGRLLRGLEELGVRLATDADPLFTPPYTTLNVGLISGGKAKNVIPGSCRMTLEWRPIPGQDPRQVLLEVQRLCADMSSGRIRASVKPSRLDSGVLVQPGELVRFLEGETGNGPETVPFGTELPQLCALGAEAAVFGPGDIRTAHRTGEFIPLDELEAATKILGRAIDRFCS